MASLVRNIKRFALPTTVLVVGLLVAYLVQYYRSRASLGDMERRLQDRGKVLVVGGEDLLELSASGSSLVGYGSESSLRQLLSRSDEAALVRTLESRGYRGLLVDTRLARPDQLPRVSIKNRLALYRPLERFTAEYLTERAALYVWHEPFEITQENAAALIGIARTVLRGEPPPAATLASEPLRRDRPCEIAVVLRGQGPALIWRSARRRSLYASVIDAAKAIRQRWQTRQARRHGPLERAIERLNVEIEVFHDQGQLADRSADFLSRALEPGIFGAIIDQPKKYRYQLPSTSVYGSLDTVERYLATVSREADLGDDGWQRQEIKLLRFRTIHYREKQPGGEPELLYRGLPPVGEDALNRARMIETIRWATAWLVDNQKPNGQFMYKYIAERDRAPNINNVVRHGLAAYAVALTYEFDRRPQTLQAAQRALRFMFDNTRFGEGPPSPDGGTGPAGEWRGKRIPREMAFVRFTDNEDNGPIGKMGTVAAAILTLTQIGPHAGISDEWRRFLVGYGNFFLFMQKEDGSFWHYYCTPNHSYYGQETSIYPGEILFGLSRVYGVTGDEKYARAFDRAMRFYERWWDGLSQSRDADGSYPDSVRVELVQFAPWISMAMNDMFPRTRNPDRARAYARFGIEVSDWIVDEYQFTDRRAFFPDYLGGYYKVATELPAMHGCVYAEGTAAAYNLARLTGDQAARRKLRRATLLGVRYIIQQTIVPGFNDFYVPNPERARGGVRYSINKNELRIDYSYHAISAVWQSLKFMPSEDLR